VIDDLFCLFEVGDPTQQLVYLGICIILFKAFIEFLQLADFAQQVGDVCVQLLDHVAD
jgi:hypothetical protein